MNITTPVNPDLSGSGEGHAYLNVLDIDVHFPIFSRSGQSIKHALARKLGLRGARRQGQQTSLVKAISGMTVRLTGGDKIGLVGLNGAGKSTLLKVLAGIYEPTRGKVEASSSPTLIADLGLGFDEDATGMQNVFLANILRGVDRAATTQVLDEIVDFADIGPAIDMPLHTYSAGMRMRLAFSIAASSPPEILLIDEVFGAGDASFIKKSVDRMEEMISSSNIFVFASHSEDLMKTFCDKCIYMKGGDAKFFGPIDEGLKMYHSDID